MNAWFNFQVLIISKLKLRKYNIGGYYICLINPIMKIMALLLQAIIHIGTINTLIILITMDIIMDTMTTAGYGFYY